MSAPVLCAMMVGINLVTLWLGYIIGRSVECSSQADKRRGWK